MSTELTDAILAMDEDGALKIVKDRLDAGEAPEAVLDDARSAMTTLGDKFACEEVFIPELIMGGEIMKGIAAELKPRITAGDTAEKRGTVVIGTVHGDIHDIGKDVVVMMLEVSGYEVHDLGIDVPVESFVAAIKEHGAQVVGLSGLLTLAFDSMKGTIEGIDAAGLRDQVKIMIGGSPVDEQVCAYSGADGWGRDAAAALADGRRLDGRCGMTPTPQELYAQREQRFNDIVALKKPDKIPFMPLMMHYFPNRIAGVSNAAVEADHFLMTKLMKEATLKFGFEWAAAVGVPPAKSCEALQMKQLRWPGGDLPDDAPFQWVEGEYIKADEVDQFLADPNGFAMRTILPRIAGIFQPLSFIQFPPMYWLANAYSTILLAPFLSAPGMKEMFEGMAAFAADAQDYMAAEGAYLGRDGGHGLSAAIRRRRVPGVRPRERLLPQSARQHARHVPPARQAAGHDRRHASCLDQPDHRRLQGDQHHARLHPHAPRRRRLHERRAVREVLLAELQRAHLRVHRERHHADAALRGRLHAAPQVPGARCRPARSRRTSTRSTASSSRRCAGTSCASGATFRHRCSAPERRSRSRTTSRS